MGRGEIKPVKISRWWGLGSLYALGLVFFAGVVSAQPRIAVLDFTLKDLTVTPTPKEEQLRSAALAPMLREALAAKGYAVVHIDATAQTHADAGFAYLYDHPDEAAQLAKRYGAEVVAVGLLHKPSFLFAYLKLRLIDTHRVQSLGEFIVEIKGSAAKVTERGIAQLAKQIDAKIR